MVFEENKPTEDELEQQREQFLNVPFVMQDVEYPVPFYLIVEDSVAVNPGFSVPIKGSSLVENFAWWKVRTRRAALVPVPFDSWENESRSTLSRQEFLLSF